MSPAPTPSDGLPLSTDLEPLVLRVLDAAKAAGATQAEASLSHSRGLSVSVRKSEVESLEFQRDRGLSLTVYFGHRKGSASTGDLSDAGIRQAMDAACAIARVTEEDPFSGLADRDRLATRFPDLSLDHPWDVTPDQAIELARACEAAAMSVDARITQSEGAGLSTQRGVSIYANSHGFVGRRSGTQHSLSCAVIAADPEGNMQRDYWYDGGRNAQLLDSAESIGRRAGERTIARLGSRRLSTRSCPVLFVPQQARGLFGHFIGAISGGVLYRKASFLLDHLDKPVFSDIVTLEQQPFIPGASSSSAFDQEGVATVQRHLVESGVLRGWLLGSYSARKLGLETTGNAGGVYNLVASHGTLGYEQLIKEMGEGLIVTELMGQGVNGVTGDYSRGAAGFWVENGAIAYPVENVTIAGNLLEMYQRIRAMGADVDTHSNIRCGSVLIDGLQLAGE
jgi:PmbA protein